MRVPVSSLGNIGSQCKGKGKNGSERIYPSTNFVDSQLNSQKGIDLGIKMTCHQIRPAARRHIVRSASLTPEGGSGSRIQKNGLNPIIWTELLSAGFQKSPNLLIININFSNHSDLAIGINYACFL
jgi:hypothetical protein